MAAASESLHEPGAIERARVRTLASEGRLLEAEFLELRRQAFPDTPPHITEHLRLCFFSGAIAYDRCMEAGFDEGPESTPEDSAFLRHLMGELQAFMRDKIMQAAAEIEAGEAGRNQEPPDAA